MASTECGWCGRLANMVPLTDMLVAGPHEGIASVTQAAFKCSNCSRYTVATRPHNEATEGHVGYRSISSVATYMASPHTRWIPKPGRSREFPDVPPHIAGAATEATLCLSSEAFRAVGALARAVLEATAKDKGHTTGSLASKIDSLAAGGHIRAFVKEQAHAIRHFGNDMAHGDFADPVDREEAEEVLELMIEVLAEVYQAPANLARMAEKRAARKTN